MTPYQVLGICMLALFLFGMIAFMARDMGWVEAIKGFAFSVGVTFFVVVGVALALGDIK